MNYRRIGQGPAILFLHGIPTCGRLWDFVVERLQRRFTCIVVDLPGFGQSPPTDKGVLDLQLYAQELDRLRQELGITSWHLVGHDGGSAIAVHYAATFPEKVKRLALLSPPVFPEFKPPLVCRLLRSRLAGDWLAPLVSYWIWNGGIQTMLENADPRLAEIVDAFHEPFRGVRGAHLLAKLVRWGDPTVVLGRTAALLAQIAAPTLVVHGRDDNVIPESFARRAAGIIPNASLQVFETGHFLPLNVPEMLSERLESFLDAKQPVTAGVAAGLTGRRPMRKGKRLLRLDGRGAEFPDEAVTGRVMAVLDQ
jgi:pimeloyl-ACP methyl ester carboxylesterase